MAGVIQTRWRQKYRTMQYPDGPAPALSKRFAGRPVVHAVAADQVSACVEQCPVAALSVVQEPGGLCLDTGKCLFCRRCEGPAVSFTPEHRLSASAREDLLVTSGSPAWAPALVESARKLFGRSLKLRQVSAGGCNACEADSNVLGTLAWDMGRFGIQFVASPRHADGLLITGPVPENMRLALEKTYQAVPEPKVVIAVGACAISGGPYSGHPEVHNGADSTVPVDLYIPGCPPHPLTILDGLLRMLGRL